MSELADSVLERLNKKPEEQAPPEAGRNIQVNRAEMFAITCRELAAVVQKNPNHPVAKVYKDAVRKNPPNEQLHVEKIDLQAMIDNLEVITVPREETVDIEGMQFKQTVFEKKLGKSLSEKQQQPAPKPGKSPANQPESLREPK